MLSKRHARILMLLLAFVLALGIWHGFVRHVDHGFGHHSAPAGRPYEESA